jgi:hypothetical protein
VSHEEKVQQKDLDLKAILKMKESTEILLEEEKKFSAKMDKECRGFEDQLERCFNENKELKKRNKKLEHILYGKKL